MADPFSWAAIGATILSAGGQVMEGVSANNAAKYTATMENQAGNNAAGAGERKAYEERRQGRLVQSRAQAVAAASGGGATDPTVLNIQGGIEAQTDYNAMNALYEGQSSKQSYDAQAELDRYEGKQALTASFINAGSTILQNKDVQGLYDKYGGGGVKKFKPGNTGYSDLPRYG